jgi:hypothetical protein
LEEDDTEPLELLASLERRFKRRAVGAPLRSPETSFEELEALDLVISLRNRLER